MLDVGILQSVHMDRYCVKEVLLYKYVGLTIYYQDWTQPLLDNGHHEINSCPILNRDPIALLITIFTAISILSSLPLAST